MSNAPDLTYSDVEGIRLAGRPKKFSPKSRSFTPVPRPDGASSAVYAVINALVAAGMDLPEPAMLEMLSSERSVSGAVADFARHGYLSVERVRPVDIYAQVSARGPVIYSSGEDVFVVVGTQDDNQLDTIDPSGNMVPLDVDDDAEGIAFLIRDLA